MNDDQLLRYSRQIMLPQIDIAGQQKLGRSHALIIGLGGLGSPVAMYLAAAGVGRLTLVDPDRVELHNLQRQIVHAAADIGRLKVESARERLLALNPLVEVEGVARRMDEAESLERVAAADVVLDASDNFACRFAVNRACVAARTPLVSGAAIRMEGQVAVFRPDRAGAPCYRCLYREEGGPEERCAESGIAAPLVGIIGSIQALEAMKTLLEIGTTLAGRLLLFDALTMAWRTVKLTRDAQCPVCGEAAAAGPRGAAQRPLVEVATKRGRA